MELNFDIINKLGVEYNEAFYILDTQTFTNNYLKLKQAFQKYYSKTNIAYSYKTNYIPRFCSIVDKLGGYAEIVSSMEFELAKKNGVDYNKIYFNGPYKDYYAVEELLINGGIINVDSLEDFEQVKIVAKKHPQNQLYIGVRINFNVGDGVVSRFGFDVDGNEITHFLNELSKQPNINLISVHTHFAQRSLKTWETRLSMLEIYIRPFLENYHIKFVSLGGGMYGNMHDSLKEQFVDLVPSFEEYAEVAAKRFSEIISQYQLEEEPEMLIEPGSALAGDAMKFCAKIYSIKKVEDKTIATVKGSMYNINPTLNKKNPPITVLSKSNSDDYKIKKYDIAGFTCIESDYLYKNFEGKLHCGDYVIFDNVGSYSIVLKPPFILPNFAVIELNLDGTEVIKRQETFDDLFKTYTFEV